MARTGRRGGILHAGGVGGGSICRAEFSSKGTLPEEDKWRGQLSSKRLSTDLLQLLPHVCLPRASSHRSFFPHCQVAILKGMQPNGEKWASVREWVRQGCMDGWNTSIPLHVWSLIWWALLLVLISKRGSWLLFCFLQPPHLCMREWECRRWVWHHWDVFCSSAND